MHIDCPSCTSPLDIPDSALSTDPARSRTVQVTCPDCGLCISVGRTPSTILTTEDLMSIQAASPAAEPVATPAPTTAAVQRGWLERHPAALLVGACAFAAAVIVAAFALRPAEPPPTKSTGAPRGSIGSAAGLVGSGLGAQATQTGDDDPLEVVVSAGASSGSSRRGPRSTVPVTPLARRIAQSNIAPALREAPVDRKPAPLKHTVARVIASRNPAIHHCYELALRENPNEGGKVQAHILVSAAGTVTDVAVSGASHGMAECMKRKLMGLEGLPPLPQPETFNQSYVFMKE